MIPYRLKLALRRLLIAVLVLAVLSACLLLCWLLWLNRYVVYTQDGAVLDFDQSLQYTGGEAPVAPETGATVEIAINENSGAEDQASKELAQFSGYYVELEALTSDFSAVKEQLSAMGEPTTILLDVKSIKSYFYYSTSVGLQVSGFDAAQLDGLIAQLKNAGHYLIARIPAFQEYQYILDDQRERVPFSLLALSKNSSWLDKSAGCYWMNPASDGTLTYLIQIITDLRSMGFDEVVLNDFQFPDSDQYFFEGNKQQTLSDTAATLVNTCATDSFAVSFCSSSLTLPVTDGRSRLYLKDVAAADAAAKAQNAGVTDPQIRVVFITELNDTRFDDYSVLRPLSSAH